MSAYALLEDRFRRIHALQSAASMLHWDASVMMPTGSGEVRGEQLAAMSGLAHELIAAPHMEEWLEEAKTETLDDWQRANLHEMERSYRHENTLPPALVEEMSRVCSASELAWREARKANDFKGYAPHLERVLACVRETAAIKAEALGMTPYDALIDQYDPGSSTALIDPLFADLAAFLPGFTAGVLEAQQRRAAPSVPDLFLPQETQQRLSRLVMERLGFDFTRGRLDISAHPFCGGAPGDVRLTTRYNERDFLTGLMGVVHETGHALYEMGLPQAWRSQPVGQARGMGLHESQSLFFEKQVAKTRAFFAFLTPLLKEITGKAYNAEALYPAAAHVQPGFIRVDADEVTYPAHILLRYELEKTLLSGDLQVADLPAAWNAAMQHYLGVTPKTDAEGCLQDIHWPDGTLGYFPSYTLGAMIAAQVFAAMQNDMPEIESLIARGEFIPITAWLNTHIHALGSKLSTQELITHATGEPLNADIYKRHLQRRYLEH